jgi:hypothetical protein
LNPLLVGLKIFSPYIFSSYESSEVTIFRLYFVHMQPVLYCYAGNDAKTTTWKQALPAQGDRAAKQRRNPG